MRIEFDPTNPTEAAAVRAMLTALGPTEVRLTGSPLDGGVLSAKIGDLSLATARVASDPWHQGTTVQREADDGWQTVEAGQVTDSNGTPWDERIHSTPSTTNKDGTWRAKRGVTAEQIAAVRAEQRASKFDAEMAEGLANDEELGLVSPAPEAPLCEDPDDPKHVRVDPIMMAAFEEPVTAPLVEPAVSAPAAPPAPPANAPSSTPTPSPTPPAPPANAGTSAPSFLDVMKAITVAQKDGKIDTAKVKELCAAVGAGESTMGLNGPDNGDKRVAFMALLAEETK